MKKYNEPEIEVQVLEAEDIVTTSLENVDPDGWG